VERVRAVLEAKLSWVKPDGRFNQLDAIPFDITNDLVGVF
jgi:hypothetical protein